MMKKRQGCAIKSFSVVFVRGLEKIRNPAALVNFLGISNTVSVFFVFLLFYSDF